MPFFVTHHIFSSTVQRITEDDAAQIAAQYPAGYRWGSLGPSPLSFYHAPFPNMTAQLPYRIYEEPSAPLFEALCRTAIRQDNPAALAYVLGFCTHYALERVSSSFIKAQANQLIFSFPSGSPIMRRHIVESSLDHIMTAEYITSDNSATYKAYRLLETNAAECIILSRTLAESLNRAYGIQISPATAYRSLHDMRKVFHLLYHNISANRRGRLSHWLKREGLLFSPLQNNQQLEENCANPNHRIWESDTETRTESFFDLFDAAIPLAVSLQHAVVERYYRDKPLDRRFFPTNFYGNTVAEKK